MTEQLGAADGNQERELPRFPGAASHLDPLMKCPRCGSSEYVDIAIAPSHRPNEWLGTCSRCRIEWPIVDV